MSAIIDISLGIGPDLLSWPNDPGVEIVPTAQLSRGDPANVSLLRLGSHTGTHVDPPFHFLESGATVEALPLDVLIGDALVADLTRISGPIGPRLIGTDFLSIEARGASGHPTHRTLLEAGVVFVEGLNPSHVEPGEYTLICLPLKILGGDGAPARAVLIGRPT